MPLLTAAEWETFLAQHPNAHLLQTAQWGEAKSSFGWQPLRIVVGSAGAQVLIRRLPFGLRLAYIPKGPLGNPGQDFWAEVHHVSRQQRAFFLRVEPDAWEPAGQLPGQFPGWRPAAPIQPRQTVVVPLHGGPEDWLARMKQKTRYNIRLAERRDVVVEESQDLDAFYQLILRTGEREGFGVHSKEYYRQVYRLFHARQSAVLLTARFEEKPLAALMAFAWGERAWYLYGASSEEERSRMPAYLLQWRAMQWAADQGCRSYDLYGIPDEPEDALEANFNQRSDGLWGVYRFKRGFGGEIRRSVGAWDWVYQPLLYRLYQIYMPRHGAAAA